MVIKMGSLTSIQLHKLTKQKLELKKGHKRESFDEVANRLMELEEKVKKEVRANKLSSALLSEKTLAKEWLSKKEEKAWKNL